MAIASLMHRRPPARPRGVAPPDQPQLKCYYIRPPVSLNVVTHLETSVCTYILGVALCYGKGGRGKTQACCRAGEPRGYVK